MEAYIKDGRVHNVAISEYFNVKLNDGENPAICPNVVMDGMPIAIMKKLAHESLKVRGRPTMKKMDMDTLKRTYKGNISWRVLYSTAGATQHAGEITMSDSELDAKIAQLRELREQPKDDFDRDIENLDRENSPKALGEAIENLGKAVEELDNNEPDYQE